jgi:hypothetical protein
MHASKRRHMIDEKIGVVSELYLPVGKMGAIYLRMLEMLEPHLIRKFWRSHPYQHGGQKVSECDLYRILWNPFLQISESYYQRIFNALEKFLYENGLGIEEFTNESFQRLKIGSYFGSENMIAWMEEILSELHQSAQPRRTILKILENGSSMAYPGSWCKVLSETREMDYLRVIQGFAPKPDFKSVMQYDANNFAFGMIKNLPNMFSMPAFEEAGFLSDGRSPQQVFWEETRIENDVFLINDEPFGKIVHFHKFIQPYIPPATVSKLGIPDWPVILMDQSYSCPIRNRLVAQSGTVLHAPLYLIEIKFLLEPFAKSKPPEGNYLNLLIQGLSGENNKFMSELGPRHEHLVSLASDSTILSLDEDRQALYSGGGRIFLGAPALILQKILEDNANPGSRFYEFRWFKFDSRIFPNPKQSNIELRLRRMKEKLEQVDLGLDFHLPGNGRLEVTVHKKFRMEVASSNPDMEAKPLVRSSLNVSGAIYPPESYRNGQS